MNCTRLTVWGTLCCAVLVLTPPTASSQASLAAFADLQNVGLNIQGASLDPGGAVIRFQFGDSIRSDTIDNQSLEQYIIAAENTNFVDAMEGVQILGVELETDSVVVRYSRGASDESIRLGQTFLSNYLRHRIIHGESDYAMEIPGFDATAREARVVRLPSTVDRGEYLYSFSKGYATISRLGEEILSFQLPMDVVRLLAISHKLEFDAGVGSSSVSVDTETGDAFFSLFVGVTLWMMAGIFAAILAAALLMVALYYVLRARRERKAGEQFRRQLLTVREAERGRLAADLHDGPIQELILTLRSLAAASERWTREPLLATTHKTLGEVKRQLRDTCMELRPPMLDYFGLASASRTLAYSFADRNENVHVTLDAEDEPDDLLPDEVRTSMYRILQECLNNITKHAEARRTWIQLTCGAKAVELMVRDDGVGFVAPKDRDAVVSDHFGLVFARQRAESVGGTLSVDSAPGAGTMVRVVVPLNGD